MELLQVYVRYTLNILHLKTVIQRAYNPYYSDNKTHFRHNIKKCALCNEETLQIMFISVSIKVNVYKYINGFEVYAVLSMK